MEDHPELMPLLTVAGGTMRGLSFRVGRDPQVIGRAPTAGIVLEDPHLSRRHAAVQLIGDGVSLVDPGVRLGRTELRYFDPGVARTDPVGLSFAAPRRDHRPTLPLPVPPTPRLPVGGAVLPLPAAPVDAHR